MKKKELIKLLKKALKEDCPKRDVTQKLIKLPNIATKAKIMVKKDGVFFGEEIIKILFEISDHKSKIVFFKHDGNLVQDGDIICEIESKSAVVLKIERVLLNFIQRLSGIATITKSFVDKLDNPKIKILDTRKTTPLLRGLEKSAVLAGGGFNHRFSLSDMVLLKENHLTQLRKIHKIEDFSDLIRKFKLKNPKIKVEVEIETLKELEEINLSEVDIIMFDEFPVSDIKKALEICKTRNFKAELEVSGNINLDNIYYYHDLPIDRISIGSLTHSFKSLDLSLICFE
ncbi:MAG: carboxylating nicotinate-nucleotide diphosphorylase [Candidatus Margulisiibacteriota bacterium]|jgi:nicotinate-nucleotide pyrophosphorylase (carboxylating)